MTKSSSFQPPKEKGEGIRYIFDPKSVAVIGASDMPMSWGNWIAKNVVEGRSRREVFLVNPTVKRVLGLQSYASIKEVGEDVELAVIVVSSSKVVPIAEDCASRGVKTIQIISGGFKEATDWGKRAQDRLTAIAHEYGVRIQGPNCNGSLNASAMLNTSSAPNRYLRESPIGFATQSGYIGNTFTYNGPATGITIGKYVSLGNECDITVMDIIEYFGDDPSIKVVMTYVEGVRDGERFRRVIESVSRKKPVVVFKVGEWESGSRAALSHTASISGSYPVFKGLLKQLGASQVQDLDMLPRIANAFVKYPLMRGSNVAIITIGAGWAVALSDTLPRGGLQVREFSPELQTRIRKLVPSERASVRNPIDFGASGSYDPAILSKLLELLFSDKEVDAIAVSGVGEMSAIEPESVELEVALATKAYKDSLDYGKPILFFTPLTKLSSPSVEKLIDKGIPICHSLSEAVVVLDNLRTRSRFLQNMAR